MGRNNANADGVQPHSASRHRRQEAQGQQSLAAEQQDSAPQAEPTAPPQRRRVE